MDLVTELLVSAHEADLQRAAQSRRLQHLIATCRRRLLGFLPIGQACTPCPT
ncbi:MAG: hypothetical protein ACRDG7_12060 [Candidatus Limnocylindria bacterium]